MKWRDRSRKEKILQVSELLTSAILVAVVVLKYIKIWMDCFIFAVPLFGMLQLLNGLLHWKSDQDLAAFHLITAVFILAVCISYLFI